MSYPSAPPPPPVDARPAAASALRTLPSVERLLAAAGGTGLTAEFSRDLVVEALRASLAVARDAIRAGGPAPGLPELIASAHEFITAQLQPTLRPVVNATGVILHTNLGRAPLSAETIAAMAAVSRGYSSLEYDLEAGARGARHEHVSTLLRRLTGAEAAVVVNNNASAVLLALASLAPGQEVIISRGQLVEIGGGFRIPDVLRQSGAHLVEVGTTNRTYAADYEGAITERTALILRVHASNFRVVGFVHAPGLGELVELAHRHGLLLVDDLGSGSLLPTERYGLAHEPMVQESIAAGADLVCFSGDKLLGGPQAGILVGGEATVGRVRQHPLMRALRPDKATLAGLRATLLHYLRGAAEAELPVWRMIAAPVDMLTARAERVVATSRALADVVASVAAIGGGSTPGETLPSRAVAIRVPGAGAHEVAAWLRKQQPPIVGHIADDRVLLDLRTVQPDEDEYLRQALARIRRGEDAPLKSEP